MEISSSACMSIAWATFMATRQRSDSNIHEPCDQHSNTTTLKEIKSHAEAQTDLSHFIPGIARGGTARYLRPEPVSGGAKSIRAWSTKTRQVAWASSGPTSESTKQTATCRRDPELRLDRLSPFPRQQRLRHEFKGRYRRRLWPPGTAACIVF